jgi:sugar phosphate isomerase/epimerase
MQRVLPLISKNWKFAYLPYFGFKSTDEALDAISSLGYEGVELPSLIPYKSSAALSEVAKKAGSLGLEISEVGFSQDFIDLDEGNRKEKVRLTKEKIQIASECGISIVKGLTGPFPWDKNSLKLGRDLSEGKAWNLVLESFNDFIETCEKFNVYFALEACFGTLTRDYYTTKELLDSVKSKNLAINLDPSHYNLYGNDVAWVVKRLGKEKIKHVHLKDSVGVPRDEGRDFIFPLLGEGTIDWKAFFQALREIEYEGYFSAEYESMNYFKNILDSDPKRTAALSLQLMKKLASM